jgi:hypothetical protein
MGTKRTNDDRAKKPCSYIQQSIPATEDAEESLEFDAEHTRFRSKTDLELRGYQMAKQEFRHRQNERRIKTRVVE